MGGENERNRIGKIKSRRGSAGNRSQGGGVR